MIAVFVFAYSYPRIYQRGTILNRFWWKRVLQRKQIEMLVSRQIMEVTKIDCIEIVNKPKTAHVSEPVETTKMLSQSNFYAAVSRVFSQKVSIQRKAKI